MEHCKDASVIPLTEGYTITSGTKISGATEYVSWCTTQASNYCPAMSVG